MVAVHDRPPRVSIVIPTLGNPLLLPCLASIRQNVPADLAYEVVVVGNGLPPDRAAALDDVEWPALRVLHTPVNVGFGAACNRGAAAAAGEYVVFLNDDTEILPGWLESLAGSADANPGAAAVGSLVLFPDGTIQEAGSVVWRDGSTSGVARGESVEAASYLFLRRVDYCSACSLLVRRRQFDAAGGFDRRYFPAYYEDVDLCFAFARDGFDVLFDPRSRVVHHESVSSSGPRKTFLSLRHRELFARKWGSELERHEPASGDPVAIARAVERARGRAHLLIVDDRPPQRGCGAGFSVLLDAVEEIAGTGWAVTVAVSDKLDGDARRLAELGVHVVVERPDEVLTTRRDEFDRVLISRPHNFERFAALVRAHQPRASLVYLAEALFYRRMQRALEVTPADAPGREQLTADMLQSREMERAIPRDADLVVCVSDEEAAILQTVDAHCPIDTIRPVERRVAPTLAGFSERSGLLFTPGWLAGDASPNVDALEWFVRMVLPRLVAQDPDIRVRVTGSNPPAAACALAGSAVELVGYVPDLRNLYEDTRVVIVPMRVGSGVKVKCLEAVQHGVPVVSTSVGAEGLALADPRAVVVADEAGAFADSVLELYCSQHAWERQRDHVLRVAGRWRAEPERTWRDVVPPVAGPMHYDPQFSGA
jgi:GT2 family glycosyltransferase